MQSIVLLSYITYSVLYVACLIAVVGGKQGHAPYINDCSVMSALWWHSNCKGSIGLSHSGGGSAHLQFPETAPDL